MNSIAKTAFLCKLILLTSAQFTPQEVNDDTDTYPFLVMVTLSHTPDNIDNMTTPIEDSTGTSDIDSETTELSTQNENVTIPEPQPSDVDLGDYIASGTIVNIRWVLSVAYRIAQFENQPLVVVGGGMSQFPKDLSDTTIYPVVERVFKEGDTKAVFDKDNLCLLKTASNMDAEAAFMDWLPKMTDNYPAKMVENIYWISGESDYQKYKMSWFPNNEAPSKKLCNFFTELAHLCLTATITEKPRSENSGENYPSEPDSRSDGGPILMDNIMQGIFIGVENDKDDPRNPPPNSGMWKNKFFYAGIRTLNIERSDDIGETYLWMKNTIDRGVERNPLNFFKTIQMRGNMSDVDNTSSTPSAFEFDPCERERNKNENITTRKFFILIVFCVSLCFQK